MSAIPPATFRSRLRRLDHGEMLQLVARIKRARGREARIDGPSVVVGGDEQRLLVLPPGRLHRLRSAPPAPGPVDRVIAPMATADRGSLPRGTPDAPVVDADDLREELLYAADPDVADELCESFLGVPARGAGWDEGAPSVSRRALGGVAVLVLVGLLVAVAMAAVAPGFGTADHGPAIGEGYERPADGVEAPIDPTVGVEDPPEAVGGPTVFMKDSRGTLEARNAADRTLLWRQPVEGEDILGANRVVDGTFYLATRSGQVEAIDALTGERRWNASTPAPLVSASPTATDEAVVVRDDDGALTAFDPVDGERLWTAEDVPDGLLGPPPVGADVVVRVTPDGDLEALELTTGDVRWTAEPPGNGSVLGARVEDGWVYATTTDRHFMAVDAATGEDRWAVTDDRIVGVDTRDGGAYVATAAGRLQAFDPGGDERWNWSAPIDETLRSPVAVDGSVYTVVDDGVVVALDRENGSVRWTADGLEDRVVAIGAADENRVYVSLDNNQVHALNRTTGEADWTAPYPVGAPYGIPVLVGETVLVETPEPSLHSIEGTTGKRAWKFDAGAGINSIGVGVADDPVAGPEDPDGPAPAVVELTDDGPVEANGTATLSATVANRGANGTVVVEWIVDGEPLEPVEVSMERGAVTAVAAEVPVPDDPGDLDYRLAVDGQPVDGQLTVLEPPTFTVTATIPEAVEPGGTVAIPVEVVNHGDREGATAVHLHAAGEVVADAQVTVPAGGTADIVLTADAPGVTELDPRSFEYPVAVTTAHDEVQASYRVTPWALVPHAAPPVVGALVVLAILYRWVRSGE